MNLQDTIDSLLKDIRFQVPPLIEKAQLKDIASFLVGYPSNQDDLTCSIRFSGFSRVDNESFMFIIHISLPGVIELDSYKYIDIIQDYINNKLNPSEYGYEYHEYKIDMLDNHTIGSIELFFEITFTGLLDDCDYRS